MKIAFVLVVSLILIGTGFYLLVKKIGKYKAMWLEAMKSLALETEHRHEELKYRNKIQRRLIEREKMLLKISGGDMSADDLNAIRSGMLSLVKKSID